MRKVSDPPEDPFSALMRKRSGEFNSPSLLVGFLYLLMRDHVTPGHIEYMMIQLAKEGWHNAPKKDMQFTNGWVAQYAQDVADRLQGRIGLGDKPQIDLPKQTKSKTKRTKKKASKR